MRHIVRLSVRCSAMISFSARAVKRRRKKRRRRRRRGGGGGGRRDLRKLPPKPKDLKYNTILPSRDDPKAREAEKVKRKEAAKAAKEAAAEKRKTKIPKHIKKRCQLGQSEMTERVEV